MAPRNPSTPRIAVTMASYDAVSAVAAVAGDGDAGCPDVHGVSVSPDDGAGVLPRPLPIPDDGALFSLPQDGGAATIHPRSMGSRSASAHGGFRISIVSQDPPRTQGVVSPTAHARGLAPKGAAAAGGRRAAPEAEHTARWRRGRLAYAMFTRGPATIGWCSYALTLPPSRFHQPPRLLGNDMVTGTGYAGGNAFARTYRRPFRRRPQDARAATPLVIARRRHRGATDS